jgi:hypothetical protein
MVTSKEDSTDRKKEKRKPGSGELFEVQTEP